MTKVNKTPKRYPAGKCCCKEMPAIRLILQCIAVEIAAIGILFALLVLDVLT